MGIPDPYLNEPTMEVDQDLYQEWVNAQKNASGWEREARRLRELLEKQGAGAHALTVNRVKVITNRPQANYAAAAIKRDYPDLVEHFTKSVLKDEFQVNDFARAHPEIAEQYRVRSFRLVVNPGDDAV
jgi:hypothetical protein